MPERPTTEAPGTTLDDDVATVHDHATWWRGTTDATRLALLTALRHSLRGVVPAWHLAACDAKGLAPSGADGAEELLSGVGTLVANLRALERSYRSLVHTGATPQRAHRLTPTGARVRVTPGDILERLLYQGVSAEVWLSPGADPTRRGDAHARAEVAVVLAGGNVASLGPRDALHQLFVEGRTVLLKANPVNDYLVPHWRAALAPLIEAGVLRIVTGGVAEGTYLCQHPLVDAVHVTGSNRTRDTILYGTGEDGAARKARGAAILTKSFSAELGNVSPYVLVPGDWSASELRYQATQLATMLTNNAGFNCLTPRVIVTSSAWPQRAAFFEALARALAEVPTRKAYYPGAKERYASVLAAHPDAQRLGAGSPERLPWGLVRNVAPSAVDDCTVAEENFCPLVTEVVFDEPSVAGFLTAATTYANDVLWGDLAATVIVDNKTYARHRVAIEHCVAQLRYGAVALNTWTGFAFALGDTTWGAYPGDDPRGSGVGTVGNALMLCDVVKTVVRAPFRTRPRPVWFCDRANAYPALEAMINVQLAPRWWKVPRLAWRALRA